MSANPVTFSENRIPMAGMDETIDEMVELFGGEIDGSADRERRFTLPLRRGVAAGGSVECTIAWAPDDAREGTVRLMCDRDIDAPKFQRVLMLAAGVLGSIAFMLWPFFPAEKEFGTLAWLGGAIAIAVYLMTLRRTSGGIAWDFLQRVARAQRERQGGAVNW